MTRTGGARLALLLCSTMLAGVATPAMAQSTPTAVAAPAGQQIVSMNVIGTQRLEPATVLSYIRLRTGDIYTQQAADQALKDLFATEFFADASIRNDNGVVTIQVRENPVINRILLEGQKTIKEDKILPEIKLAPRQIFTRSKVRADVARIIELYKRKGRFAATVEPKAVQLDQNRVDIVFEINEGPKSKVQQINILGNKAFSDGELRGEMVTKQARFWRFLSSGTSYDPDRLAYDQQKLRQFYLTEGYADFRVVSAVAELTPDRKDFIITYVVEEGERYKFGDVKVESALRDLKPELLEMMVPMKAGEWYDAKAVEDTVERLSESAGAMGYANADIRPQFKRDKSALTMAITFEVAQSPRVYVEDVKINGNTVTRDKVIRREMRLTEGDVFNGVAIKRSTDRIKSLGYFQEKFEIEQAQGSSPDRIVLTSNVEEGNTGELQLSAGFSSLEKFIFQGSIRKRNFRGLGQELRASVSYSTYSKSAEIGFTEPYLFDKNIAISGDIFRRDYNSFNYYGSDRRTTYQQVSTGFQLRTGIPINEYLYGSLRYGLSYDQITLAKDQFYSDRNNDDILSCDPVLAGRYLCDSIGNRVTSTLGLSLVYDDRDNRIRPTRGQSASLSVDWAGLGGDVKYVKTRLSADKYFHLGKGFVFSIRGEGGYVQPLESRTGTEDDIRLVDRYFLGEPQMRGFDIRGVGPRVIRYSYALDTTTPGTGALNLDRSTAFDDALGGRAYYLGHLELEIPLGTGAKEMGLRPSIFMDVGSVFKVKRPGLTTIAGDFTDTDGKVKYQCLLADGGVAFGTQATTTTNGVTTASGAYAVCPTGARAIAPFEERYFGDVWKPRLSVGIGVNWNSPFGPFRIDVAKALLKEEGDDTKLFTFNVGTQF